MHETNARFQIHVIFNDCESITPLSMSYLGQASNEMNQLFLSDLRRVLQKKKKYTAGYKATR